MNWPAMVKTGGFFKKLDYCAPFIQNQDAMRKYLAEFIGTFVLVLFGCGSAVIGGDHLGLLGIAFAFGLSIVAMAYSIGNISGCHINPAVSLAMLISKKMGGKDFVGYIIAQFIGGIAAAGVLKMIVDASSKLSMPSLNLGQNGYEAASSIGLSMGGAFGVEVILTFVFILTILGVTSSEKTANVAGIVIGLTLAFVHILGIPFTGTSVNPARSFGPAFFVGGEAMSQVWLFIAAPFAGAILAAIVWKVLSCTCCCCKKEQA